MAKDKKQPAGPPPAACSPDDFADRVFAEVERDYGGGVLIDGLAAVADRRVVIPWTPALDVITSGGVEEGSWVGVTGNEKTGKTCACLTFAASAQRPEFGGRPVYYFKVEGRLSSLHLRGIAGLDLAKGRFHIVQSRPADEARGLAAKILTAEEHLRIALAVLKTVPRAVVIIDSISALCSEAALNEGVGGAGVAVDARLFASFLNVASNVVPVNRCVVLGITQLISNIGQGQGPKFSEKVARRWKYQCDYQLRTIGRSAWEAAGTQVGLVVRWACNTSALGPPGMTIDGHLRFGVGFDRVYECLQLGTQANLVKKAGAWLTLSYLAREAHRGLWQGDEPPRAQGAEKAYRLLRDHPEWARALEAEVAALAGGPAAGGPAVAA